MKCAGLENFYISLCGPAADCGGDAASVSHDLSCADTVSIADSDISFVTSAKSTDSRFTRLTG